MGKFSETVAYYDHDGNLHYPGENKNQATPGESGESGEKPHEQTNKPWRKNGEIRQNSPHSRQKYKPPVYPVDALGPLADACRFMINEVQLPPETAGQSLLSVTSLLTQGLYDVETLAGTKPLSLFCITLAESGDGKSTADDIALRKINEADRADHDRYAGELQHYTGMSKNDQSKSDPPMAPYRTIKSGTIQGIVRSLKEGIASQGSFTAEGAAMLGGWGMSNENKGTTLAGLNSLWDGGSLSIVRQGDGRTQLYDKRFCCHWLIQPDAARNALNDDLMTTIGTWPRFLVAWPAPMTPRAYKPFRPEDNAAMMLFWSRCEVLLNERYSIHPDTRRVINLSDNAHAILVKFWERMEQSRNPNNPLNPVRTFCIRGSEQVCRIAGVLAAFKNHSAGITDFHITDEDVTNAIKLFVFSLDTWKGIFGNREDIEHQALADALHTWMLKRTDGKANDADILKRGPRRLRSRSARDTAISVLQEEGRIERVYEVMPNGEITFRNMWRAIDAGDH